MTAMKVSVVIIFLLFIFPHPNRYMFHSEVHRLPHFAILYELGYCFGLRRMTRPSRNPSYI